jgi:DNA-binding MarR family transcriptional regulator
MKTVKMIHRFAQSRMSKSKQFEKLSGPRVGVLFIVHEAGSIRMGDLATKLSLAPRTVTDLVDGLERDGFLKRVPDPSDRRAMRLELTQSTKNNFGKIQALRKAFVNEVFSVLTPEEQKQFVKILKKIGDGPLAQLSADATADDSFFEPR